MTSRLNIRWLAWPAIVALLVFMGLSSSVRVAQAGPAEDKLTVIDPAGPVGLGGSFSVYVEASTDEDNFQGYQDAISFDSTIVNATAVTQLATGTMSLCGGTSYDNGVNPGNAYDNGCSSTSAVGPYTDNVTQVDMTCVGVGVSTLHLIDLSEDPDFGSTLLATGGGSIVTVLYDGSVECQEQSDMAVTKTGDPEPAIAGGLLTYTITATNLGPSMARGLIIGDDLPDEKVYVPDSAWVDVDSDTVVDLPCLPGWQPSYPLDEDGDTLIDEDPVDTVDNDGDTLVDEDPPNINILQCVITGPLTGIPAIMPGQTVTVTATVEVPLSDAGKINVNAASAFLSNLGGEPDPTVDPNPANDVGIWVTNVAPADVSIVKSGPASALTGNGFQYTIDLHSEGPSPATDVVVTDPLPSEVTFDGVSASCDTAAISCSEAGGVVTCEVTGPMPVSESCTITTDVTCASAGTTVNQAEVCWADPLCAQSDPVTTIQLPPYNGMVKDCRPDLPGIQDECNLWLCKTGPDCHVADPITGAQIGKGILDVGDFIFLREDDDSPNDSDTDPEGLAAYEEQIKYDHKVFDVAVADAGSDGLDNDGDTVIDNIEESVIAGWRGNVDCTATIMTENWIMFGCVSSGQQLGNPQPVAEWLKTISLTPDPDMFQRIRPTKDNGVVSTVIDENCEVADMYASEPWPFTLPGGLTEDCTDLTVTVRMLEGDLNLDCMVNVLDEQIIAGRYGSFFGLLLYNSFYDLEPKTTDFDIDIKDLQFVFGRDGSMCQAPIPNQDPEPAIPDP
jgi:uncharacterized repeat protein (TIGR01451 family)